MIPNLTSQCPPALMPVIIIEPVPDRTCRCGTCWKNGAWQTMKCVTALKSRQCHTSLTPVPWPNLMAVHNAYTLQMRLLSTGWRLMAPRHIWQQHQQQLWACKMTWFSAHLACIPRPDTVASSWAAPPLLPHNVRVWSRGNQYRQHYNAHGPFR